MCAGCLQEYADEHGPAARPDNADEALAAIVALYARPNCGGTGGPLHVEIDDMNLDLEWEPWNGTNRDGTPYFDADDIAAATVVGDLMRPMTMPQRAWVVGAFWERP